jgi:hypothetical protein
MTVPKRWNDGLTSSNVTQNLKFERADDTMAALDKPESTASTLDPVPNDAKETVSVSVDADFCSQALVENFDVSRRLRIGFMTRFAGAIRYTPRASASACG